MYRAVVYYRLNRGNADVRLQSEGTKDEQSAVTIFDALLRCPGVIGGHIERHVKPFGWILEDNTQ